MTAKTKAPKKKSAVIRKNNRGSVYDWDSIKLEYFKAEETELATFLRDKYGIETKKNGGVNKQIKGWKKEKQEMKANAMLKAKQKLEELYTPSAKELAEMHQASITILKAGLNKALADCVKDGKVVKMPDVATIERIWRIVKAEKLEPTAVQKTENSVTHEDRDLMRRLLASEFSDDEEEE